jgi:hypothetical protein
MMIGYVFHNWVGIPPPTSYKPPIGKTMGLGGCNLALLELLER